MRLVDADEFVKKVVEYSHQSTKTIGMALEATPTVDAVQVVRCEDCVHKDVPCPLYGGSQFFCAYGERRSE